MNDWRKVTSAAVALYLLVPVATASGKRRDLKGTIVAYDPSYHALKQPSFVRDLEVTIADVGGERGKRKFIKLVFEGFGAKQVADDVLDGRRPFDVGATRDQSCDQTRLQMLSGDKLFQGSGAFVMNQTHQTQILQGVSRLECYRVQVGK